MKFAALLLDWLTSKLGRRKQWSVQRGKDPGVFLADIDEERVERDLQRASA